MDNTEKIRLEIVGISYSALKSNAFALLLGEVGGRRRIPVVIGAAEAQSIAIKLEGIVTPRPMTHDLFCSFSHAFGISLEQVYIYKLVDGIFSAELTFTDGIREAKLDSRTSDAIAIAVRTGAPIYTTREILDVAGSDWDDDISPSSSTKDGNNDRDPDPSQPEPPKIQRSAPKSYDEMSLAELEQTMERLVGEEDYEEAARVNEIIKRRKNN